MRRAYTYREFRHEKWRRFLIEVHRMKALPLFVPLLAVVATPLWFHSPAPTLGAQDRGQAVRKTDAEPRTALVIGNGAYAESPLANPVNDARDMSWWVW